MKETDVASKLYSDDNYIYSEIHTIRSLFSKDFTFEEYFQMKKALVRMALRCSEEVVAIVEATAFELDFRWNNRR